MMWNREILLSFCCLLYSIYFPLFPNNAAGTSVEVAIGVVVSAVLLVLLVVGTVLTVMIIRKKMGEHEDRQQV